MLREIIDVLWLSPVLLYVVIGASCALAMFTVWLTWYLEKYHPYSLVTILLITGLGAIFIAATLHYVPAAVAIAGIIVLFLVGSILWIPILALRWIFGLFEYVPSPPLTITPTLRIARIVDSTSTEMDTLSSDYRRRVDALIAQSRQKTKGR